MDELVLILTDICQCSRVDLYGKAPSKVLSVAQLQRLERILKQRARSIPVQYSMGRADFMGLVLKVNKQVLIPRPETEQLVETALEVIAKSNKKRSLYTILDIGTGSGCIAIALAKYVKRAIAIVAVDISKHALRIAAENARMHAVGDTIQFLQSDFFNHRVFTKDNQFDMIIANPPYVPTDEIGAFDVTTTNEPRIALDGGSDGCDVYRRLRSETLAYVKKDGCFLFEMGDGQANIIRTLFSKDWIIVRFIKDYRNIERICLVRPKRNHNG